MHIDSIELFHVALPLKKRLEGAGARFSALETVLVRLRSAGTAGWGEASPGNAPVMGPDWAAGVFACLRDWLAPAVAGTDVSSGDELQKRLEHFHGNRFAKAALDTAWWDLRARQEGQPLHQLLGAYRDAIEVGPTFDQMDSPEEFLAAIGRALDAGFARVKLMFRPGWDIRMVDAVRKEFPTQTFHIDVEGALGVENMEILYRIDDFQLAMVEQPLAPDDLVGHAMLQDAIRTPVALDESITTPGQASMALDLRSCRYVNVAPGRVGGLSPAVAIHDLCLENHVPCWVGASPQSAIGARLGLALAAKANFTYPADYFPSDDVLEQDLAEPPLPVRSESDGVERVPLWSEPGLGVEPQEDLLAKFCLAQAKL